MSPTYHSYKYVFLPYLSKVLGSDITYNLKWHGLFPCLMGCIDLTLPKVTQSINPIVLKDREQYKGAKVLVDYVQGGIMDSYYNETFKSAFSQSISEMLPSNVEFIENKIVLTNEKLAKKVQTLAVSVVIEYESPTMLCANILIEKEIL